MGYRVGRRMKLDDLLGLIRRLTGRKIVAKT